MKKHSKPSAYLAQIEKDYFCGVDLLAASQLSDDARRAFRLEQVDRLLKEKFEDVTLAKRLSDLFWTGEEGRASLVDDHPLWSADSGETLSEEERLRLQLIMEVAGLCRDLSMHYPFDLTEAFGIRNDLWVTNQQLTERLTHTAYEQVAMHTAYLMKKYAISTFGDRGYLPAQDEMAELYSTDYHCLVGMPETTEMPPHAYTQEILQALQRIERHWRRGRRRKIHSEVVILHDEICGCVPSRFYPHVLRAAQSFFNYMDKEVYGKLVAKDSPSRNDQTKALTRRQKMVMERFAEKIRDMRFSRLFNEKLEDYSLAYNYLMAHAQRCGNGCWRKEEDAL